MIDDKKKFTYRNITNEDKNNLKQLGIIAYQQFGSTLTIENKIILDQVLSDEKKVENLIQQSTGFACIDGNEIIGMAYLIPHGNPWDVFKSEWSYIRMVGVNPKYQGKGIAKTLTQMCIDYAKETKEKTIALHTSEEMHAARHLYESLGFKQLQEIEPRFGKRYWLYTLDLN